MQLAKHAAELRKPHRLGNRARHLEAAGFAQPLCRIEHARVESADDQNLRDASVISQITQELDSIAVRDPEIEGDDVGLKFFVDRFEAMDAIGRPDIEPATFGDVADCQPDMGVVIYE